MAAAQSVKSAPSVSPIVVNGAHAALPVADNTALLAQLAALTAERDALLAKTVAPAPAQTPAAAAVASTLPTPVESATAAAFAATQDTLLSMGIVIPTWKQVAFSSVLFVAAVVGAYVAAPVLASILVAGTATVTMSGFAAWVAAALGYLIATWASFKAAKSVGVAVNWIGKFAPDLTAKPLVAA